MEDEAARSGASSPGLGDGLGASLHDGTFTYAASDTLELRIATSVDDVPRRDLPPPMAAAVCPAAAPAATSRDGAITGEVGRLLRPDAACGGAVALAPDAEEASAAAARVASLGAAAAAGDVGTVRSVWTLRFFEPDVEHQYLLHVGVTGYPAAVPAVNTVVLALSVWMLLGNYSFTLASSHISGLAAVFVFVAVFILVDSVWLLVSRKGGELAAAAQYVQLREWLRFLPTCICGLAGALLATPLGVSAACSDSSDFFPSIPREQRVATCRHGSPQQLLVTMVVPVLLGRPRCVLTVPFLALSAVLFSVSRFLGPPLTAEINSSQNALSLFVYFAAFAIGCICVIKEKAQRDEFDLFRADAAAVRDANSAVQALTAHLQRLLPPLLHTRVLSGNLVDVSRSATVVAVQIEEFQTWCSEMLPKLAAVLTAQVAMTVAAVAELAGIDHMRSVGDSFLLTSNLLQEASDHTRRACVFAVDLQDRIRRARGERPVAIRQGIATGYVVGAVLGQRFLRYDVFGGTIEEATRLLFNCPCNCVVASSAVKDSVRGSFEFDSWVEDANVTPAPSSENSSLRSSGTTASGAASAEAGAACAARPLIWLLRGPVSRGLASRAGFVGVEVEPPRLSVASSSTATASSRGGLSSPHVAKGTIKNSSANNTSHSNSTSNNNSHSSAGNSSQKSSAEKTATRRAQPVSPRPGSLSLGGGGAGRSAEPSKAGVGGVRGKKQDGGAESCERGSIIELDAGKRDARRRLYGHNTNAALLEDLAEATRDAQLVRAVCALPRFASSQMEAAFRAQQLPLTDRLIPTFLIAAYFIVRLTMLVIHPATAEHEYGGVFCFVSGLVLLVIRAALSAFGFRDSPGSGVGLSVGYLVHAGALACLGAASTLFLVGQALISPGPGASDNTDAVVVLSALFAASCGLHARISTPMLLLAFAFTVVFPYFATLMLFTSLPRPSAVVISTVVSLVLFPLWLLHGHVLGRRLFRLQTLLPLAQRALESEAVAYNLVVASFPKVVAEFTQQRRAAGSGLGVSTLADTAVTCIRFDGLESSFASEATAIALAGVVDLVVSELDYAVAKFGTVVGCVNVFGDTAVIAGPLQNSRDAVGVLAVQACRETMAIIAALQAKRLRFTSASTVDTCFAVVSDVDYPTFDLLGRAVNVSRQVVNAAAPGTIVCNELFATLYNSALDVAAPPRGVAEPLLMPARQWRIRSLGMLLLHTVRFTDVEPQRSQPVVVRC